MSNQENNKFVRILKKYQTANNAQRDVQSTDHESISLNFMSVTVNANDEGISNTIMKYSSSQLQHNALWIYKYMQICTCNDNAKYIYTDWWVITYNIV